MTLLEAVRDPRADNRFQLPHGSVYRSTVFALGSYAVMAAAVIAVPAAAHAVKYLALLVPFVIAVGLARHEPAEYLEFSLWIWVLWPSLRRLVDWRTGFDANSPVLLAPLAVSSICLLILARPRITGHRTVVRLMLRMLVLIPYAALVAVVLLRSPMAVGLGFLQLAAPLSLGLTTLVAVKYEALTSLLTRFATGALLTTGSYGVYQFVVAPAWDVQWLKDVSDVADSFGRPFPFEIRVFSTLNDPGSLAAVLVFCILWLLNRRRLSPLDVTALVIGGSCLALTLVRSGWIALAVGITLAVLRGWIKPERLLMIVIGLGFVASISTVATAPVLERWDASRTAGAKDESLQARVTFQSREVVPALLDMTGQGVGSTGIAARRDGNADPRFADSDSGFLENLRVFGGPLGATLLIGTFCACWAVFRRPFTLSRGAACYAMTVPVQMVFATAYVNVTGVLLWVALAAASHQAE